MTTTLDEYWSKIERALSARLTNGASLDEIANELLCDPSMATSAGRLYAAAHCRYMHPDRVDSEGRSAELHSIAQRVFALDPDHAHMWLFVGFDHFDAGDLSAAALAFDRVDEAELDADDRVKKDELRLCCAVHGLALEAALPLIESFAARCLQEQELDVFPVHLLGWVERVCKESAPSREGRMEDLLGVYIDLRRGEARLAFGGRASARWMRPPEPLVESRWTSPSWSSRAFAAW